MTTDDLNAKLAEFHAALLAKGYDAAHVEIALRQDVWGFSVGTWVHVLTETPFGFKTAREPERRNDLRSVEDAVAALAQSIADIPPRYTAADLDPWFDPHHEMNRVSA